jgi:hypothetical protein
MSARRKLNQLYATGAMLLAGFLGLVFQSWWAFAAFLIGGVGLNVWGGNIRLARR